MKDHRRVIIDKEYYAKMLDMIVRDKEKLNIELTKSEIMLQGNACEACRRAIQNVFKTAKVNKTTIDDLRKNFIIYLEEENMKFNSDRINIKVLNDVKNLENVENSTHIIRESDFISFTLDASVISNKKLEMNRHCYFLKSGELKLPERFRDSFDNFTSRRNDQFRTSKLNKGENERLLTFEINVHDDEYNISFIDVMTLTKFGLEGLYPINYKIFANSSIRSKNEN